MLGANVLFQFALWLRSRHPLRVGDRSVVSSRFNYKLDQPYLTVGGAKSPRLSTDKSVHIRRFTPIVFELAMLD